MHLPIPTFNSGDGELDRLNDSLPAGYHAWRGVTGWLYVRRERSSPPWVQTRETAAEIRSAVDEHERKITQ